MANHNIGRLAEDIKREISVAMSQLKDKNISGGLVTVTQVELTNDLSYCKVYISALGGGIKTENAVKTLQKAEGFFKKRINARIKMRKLPEFIFVEDNSLDYYEKISGIINRFSSPSANDENGSSDNEEAGSGETE